MPSPRQKHQGCPCCTEELLLPVISLQTRCTVLVRAVVPALEQARASQNSPEEVRAGSCLACRCGHSSRGLCAGMGESKAAPALDGKEGSASKAAQAPSMADRSGAYVLDAMNGSPDTSQQLDRQQAAGSSQPRFSLWSWLTGRQAS